jgi:GNAT superfamily N-acetyltransferase
MDLSIDLQNPVMKGAYDWQLTQEINVKNKEGNLIAKAEIELVTLNKHRDAEKSYSLIDEQEATDWEIPFGVYFKKHNLITEYCEKLAVKPDTNAKTHIMIEALSVQPTFRKQGVAAFLLQSIAEHYPKAQSLNVMSMPINLFVDIEYCEGEENTQYYKNLDLQNEKTTNEDLDGFWTKSGFIPVNIDESLLAEPLTYSIYLASPASIIAAKIKK